MCICHKKSQIAKSLDNFYQFTNCSNICYTLNNSITARADFVSLFVKLTAKCIKCKNYARSYFIMRGISKHL